MTSRVTRQQQAIRAALAASGEFRSAQQLHALLKDQGHAIGLATVYRALARLVDAGEVDALTMPEGETGYRACSAGHHHHLVCRQCGRTVEVAGPSVETWARVTAKEYGFTEVSHTLEIFGRCSACREAGREA